MNNDLDQICAEILERIKAVSDFQALESIRVSALGKRDYLAADAGVEQVTAKRS